jgi:uncharacterized Rmd1/YagE family protein
MSGDRRKLRVSAWALSASVPVAELPRRLGLREIERDRKRVILADGGSDSAFVVAYDFGAIVMVGVDPEREKEILARWRASIEPADRVPTTEDFVVEVETDVPVSASFDTLSVPELTTPLVGIVGRVIAQSVAMEHIETEVDAIMLKLERYAEALRVKGDYRGTKRELLRFIGHGLSLSNRAVLTLSLLDPPLASWDDEVLDRAHRGLREAFGIEERYRALDHKLNKIQGSLELLVDLVHHKRSQLLEAVVIALIAVEIVIFFVERATGTAH